MRPRRAHRQDDNHATIRQAFLDAGCSWMDTYQLGAGRPDGVAALGGLCICIEIKDPSKPPSKQRLTPDEEKWHRTWTGGMRIVKDLQDVSDTVEVLKDWHRAIKSQAVCGVETTAGGAGASPFSPGDPSIFHDMEGRN